MAAVVPLSALLEDRRLWRGQTPLARTASSEPTGHAVLDAALPSNGWPEAALSEILLPADGVGELQLVLPTLARHTQAGRDIALIAPPYVPFPRAWIAAGVDFARVQLIAATAKEALWASEQCLRAGCLAAVLCWPRQVDDKALRRLQVAAESGRTLGFVFRDRRAALNASPAALRLQLEAEAIRVLKCRGGLPPSRALPFPRVLH
jgi:cell division inhibitor SulA